MLCPYCQKSIPGDALFCIYCGTRLQRPVEVQAAPSVAGAPRRPATGETIDLRRGSVAMPSPSRQQAAKRSLPRQPYINRRPVSQHPRRSWQDSAWLLMGLGLLFLWPILWSALRILFTWPGLVVLAGLLCYISRCKQGRYDEGVRSLVFCLGLAFLLVFNLVWPGILLLLFLMMTLFKPRRASYP